MNVFILLSALDSIICTEFHALYAGTVTYANCCLLMVFLGCFLFFFFPFCNFNEAATNNFVLHIYHHCKYTYRINSEKWIAGLKGMYKFTQSCLILCFCHIYQSMTQSRFKGQENRLSLFMEGAEKSHF